MSSQGLSTRRGATKLPSKSRRAYTLFELIVVMALMVIIAALAMPMALQNRHEDVKVTSACDVVRARWADCRARAQEESRPYKFSVIPNSGKFKIEPAQGNSLLGPGMVSGSIVAQVEGGGSSSNSSSADSGGGFSIEDALPKGVRFGTKEQPASSGGSEAEGGEYVLVAVFMPDGTALEDVEVHFGAKGSPGITLQLEASTGASSIVNNIGEK
jgi:prepilin-type N-terminal cleavage/methylation domain-containing protein